MLGNWKAVSHIQKCYGWFDRSFQSFDTSATYTRPRLNQDGEIAYGTYSAKSLCPGLVTLNELYCKTGNFNENREVVNIGMSNLYFCKLNDSSDAYYFDQDFWFDAEQQSLYASIDTFVVQDALEDICDIHNNIY